MGVCSCSEEPVLEAVRHQGRGGGETSSTVCISSSNIWPLVGVLASFWGSGSLLAL